MCLLPRQIQSLEAEAEEETISKWIRITEGLKGEENDEFHWVGHCFICRRKMGNVSKKKYRWGFSVEIKETISLDLLNPDNKNIDESCQNSVVQSLGFWKVRYSLSREMI